MAETTIISVPRPLSGPPIRMINRPRPPKIEVILTSVLKGITVSPTVINFETNIELINMATKSEEPKTTESVIGK